MSVNKILMPTVLSLCLVLPASAGGLDFNKALKRATGVDVEKSVSGTAKTLEKAATTAKEDVDSTLTTAKEDVDSTLTTAKEDVDSTLQIAWEDIVTEFNYFMATQCGQSSEAKKLQRDYDQGRISRSEFVRRFEALENGKDCGMGVGYDSEDGAYLTDSAGNRSELPPKRADNSPVEVSSPSTKPHSEAAREPASEAADEFVLAKPPLTATPLGQALSHGYQMSDGVAATPSSGGGNAVGGYPGWTRKNGDGSSKFHRGLDDGLPSGASALDVPAVWHGTNPGRVTAAQEHAAWGTIVTIRTKDARGMVWDQTTLHHHTLGVEKGDIIQPGQVYARGAGNGTQFESKQAGAPHVHVNVFQVLPSGERVPVNIASGERLYPNDSPRTLDAGSTTEN